MFLSGSFIIFIPSEMFTAAGRACFFGRENTDRRLFVMSFQHVSTSVRVRTGLFRVAMAIFSRCDEIVIVLRIDSNRDANR